MLFVCQRAKSLSPNGYVTGQTETVDWVWRNFKLFDQGSITQARAAVREAPPSGAVQTQ